MPACNNYSYYNTTYSLKFIDSHCIMAAVNDQEQKAAYFLVAKVFDLGLAEDPPDKAWYYDVHQIEIRTKIIMKIGNTITDQRKAFYWDKEVMAACGGLVALPASDPHFNIRGRLFAYTWANWCIENNPFGYEHTAPVNYGAIKNYSVKLYELYDDEYCDRSSVCNIYGSEDQDPENDTREHCDLATLRWKIDSLGYMIDADCSESLDESHNHIVPKIYDYNDRWIYVSDFPKIWHIDEGGNGETYTSWMFSVDTIHRPGQEFAEPKFKIPLTIFTSNSSHPAIPPGVWNRNLEGVTMPDVGGNIVGWEDLSKLNRYGISIDLFTSNVVNTRGHMSTVGTTSKVPYMPELSSYNPHILPIPKTTSTFVVDEIIISGYNFLSGISAPTYTGRYNLGQRHWAGDDPAEQGYGACFDTTDYHLTGDYIIFKISNSGSEPILIEAYHDGCLLSKPATNDYYSNSPRGNYWFNKFDGGWGIEYHPSFVTTWYRHSGDNFAEQYWGNNNNLYLLSGQTGYLYTNVGLFDPTITSSSGSVFGYNHEVYGGSGLNSRVFLRHNSSITGFYNPWYCDLIASDLTYEYRAP
jgi:hypothetical protein